jgi:hypothetical protein
MGKLYAIFPGYHPGDRIWTGFVAFTGNSCKTVDLPSAHMQGPTQNARQRKATKELLAWTLGAIEKKQY